MFTDLYFDTINPLQTYKRLFSLDVLFSALIHTIMYVVVIYIVVKVFKFKFNKFKELFLCLFVVMFLGYFGRLSRAKDIHKHFLKEKDSVNKTINLMHNGYFCWFFLG